MKERFFTEHFLRRVLLTLLLVFAALLSVTVIGSRASSPEVHAATIASIDEKKDTVTALTASSTLASAIISAIPDDTATPIAERLSELTEYFLIVLCVLYAEKYLLTVIGFAVFRILIPLGCAAAAVSLFARRESGALRRLAWKLALCSLLLYLAIPVSIRTADMIYSTYEASIESTISAAEQISDEADEMTAGDESLWNVITGAAASFKDSASKILNRFVEALAVMIVTSCVIPILVLLFFVWLLRTLTAAELAELPNRSAIPSGKAASPDPGRPPNPSALPPAV